MPHVDNCAVVGHFATDTLSLQPGMPTGGLNVPHE
ncbi:UNVERIFIED_ORG: hypothetical protein ABIB21_000818 [Arthrobacter sp. UYEF13]